MHLEEQNWYPELNVFAALWTVPNQSRFTRRAPYLFL